MALVKMNSEEILHRLMEKANENGYSIVINGTKDDSLNIVAYPFRGTLCSQEELAHALSDVLEESGVMERPENLRKFKADIEPDNLDEFVYSDDTEQVNISVFHNKNILLKHIIMKL